MNTLPDAANPTSAGPVIDNGEVAQSLREMAVLLEGQGDNPFRVAAYRRAADTVAQFPKSLRLVHAVADWRGCAAHQIRKACCAPSLVWARAWHIACTTA